MSSSEESEQASVRSSELESESIDSDELEQADQGDVHGFIYASKLDTYRKSKRERKEAELKERELTKEDRRKEHRKRERKNKNVSKTNELKTKNKSFNMLLPKRVKQIYQKDSDVRGMLKKRDRNAIGQLGHFHKSTRQTIQAKKRRLQF